MQTKIYHLPALDHQKDPDHIEHLPFYFFMVAMLKQFI